MKRHLSVKRTGRELDENLEEGWPGLLEIWWIGLEVCESETVDQVSSPVRSEGLAKKVFAHPTGSGLYLNGCTELANIPNNLKLAAVAAVDEESFITQDAQFQCDMQGAVVEFPNCSG